jgi:peptidoglycan hydrolase-like protein with peptidoglycan-binding domain
MMKQTLWTLGLSAMLAMPMLAVGQQSSTTPGTSGGMGPGAGGSGTRMEQRGQQQMSQELIREAQQELKDAGFYKGSIDGVLGQQTTEAIRDYQKSRGLPETGRLDEPTQELLLAQKSEHSPAPRGSSPGSMTPSEPAPRGSSPGSMTPSEPSPRSNMPGGSTGGSGMGGSSSGR